MASIPVPKQNPQTNLGRNDSPLDENDSKPQQEAADEYTTADVEYISYLQLRLETSKNVRNQTHDEFKGLTYLQDFDANEKVANTVLPPEKNKGDVVVSSGTIEQKLDALLSHVDNLNLGQEVLAFDKNANNLSVIGSAFTDILHQTNELDGADGAGDQEKKIARQRELMKQRAAFVQEEWKVKWETKKTLTGKPNGKFKNGVEWTTKLEKVFEGASRELLYGPSVYLGDITEFYMENQPYMFVVKQISYEKAKAIYGVFDNFEFVQAGSIPSTNSEDRTTSYSRKWRLTEVKKDQVEVIIYQDQPKDEFQIMINGVLMVPIGFPLSAVTPLGKYNIAKQVGRVINSQFAYGSAFVAGGSIQQISKILDEMLTLFVLKTRKSVAPPYLNLSGRVIPKTVLSPGRITMGVDPGALVPLESGQNQGVTAGEFAFFDRMQGLIDQNTVSPSFTGQNAQGNQTATQVVNEQRQARLTLGLIITACSLLEKKLGYLRLWNILQNWFEPTGTRVVGLNDGRRIIKEFRRTNREVNIDKAGLGQRSVIPVEGNLPDSKAIRAVEREEERRTGFPVRKVFLSAPNIRASRLLWYIVVNPKEKDSSPLFKLMFREQLTDMMSLINLGSVPNKDGLEEEFSRIWGKPRNKLFSKSNGQQPQEAMEGARTPEQNVQAQGRSSGAAQPGAVLAGGGG